MDPRLYSVHGQGILPRLNRPNRFPGPNTVVCRHSFQPHITGELSPNKHILRLTKTHLRDNSNIKLFVIMGGPKPKFHPFYLQQDGDDPDTWLDPGAKAAGWKRYQVREVPWNPPLPPGANENMKTVLHPLEAGVSFCSRVHLHNLRREVLQLAEC